MVEHLEVRRGAYHDSVSLMQASRRVAAVPGVEHALVAMATPLNLDLLRGLGFAPPEAAAADLLVALRAADDGSLTAARQELAAALAPPAPSGTGSGPAPVRPRTTGSAVRRAGAPAGTVALISVPGPAAFVEAMDALQAGAHVLVFSDNVPLAHELRLKDEAAARGRLLMGPDCGTAIVGGLGLGFANAVRSGPVGVVAASGTGAQQLTSLLDAAGVGISHCLGVGGRDLSEPVAGRSTLQALAMLDADPATELIVLVSKPPADAVAADVRRFAATLATPVQFALLGPGRPDLTAAARAATEAVGLTWADPQWWPAPVERTGVYRRLRGGFCGGSLCDEAMAIVAAAVGEPVASNIPFPGAPALTADLRGLAGGGGLRHALVDFGDDALTQGRAHPMIDPSLRLDWVREQTAGVLLLDVVLGHGAHPDPAGQLAPVLAALPDSVAKVISLCGTDADPQGLQRQALALVGAGASVHRSNAHAARKAVELLTLEDG
jgi:FdrA protein